MMRIFQQLERAPLGINVRIENRIPLNSGLGAEAAFTAAGVIGADNLMGNVFTREELIARAAQIYGRPDSVIASILGGLTASSESDFMYCSLPLRPFKMLIAVPEIEDYESPEYPERVDTGDVIHDMGRMALMVEALRQGDLKLFVRVLDNKLHRPFITPNIPGFAHITQIARLAGATAVTSSGDGPAMVILAEEPAYERIAEAVETAFENLAMRARLWIVPVDTQGIVISMMQSA
jgi:homoserine kinase